MKKYLIKSSAFTLALAMMLGLSSCKDDVQVETATDVAAVESASDIVTTASTTSQTEATTEVVTEIVTDAQGNTQVVTAAQAEGATTAKSDTKVSTNGDTKASPATKATAKTTKKTTAKAATAKTTVKTTAKKTTAKPQPKTTAKATTKATTKQSGLTKADYDWVLEEGIKYIKSLPKAKIDSSAAGYSFEGITSGNATSRKELLMHIKEAIDLEYNDFVGNGGIGMNLSLKSTGESYPYPQYEYVLRYITYLN